MRRCQNHAAAGSALRNLQHRVIKMPSVSVLLSRCSLQISIKGELTLILEEPNKPLSYTHMVLTCSCLEVKVQIIPRVDFNHVGCNSSEMKAEES